jgi:uncharacterized protein YlxP (DUF503 family)
MVARIKDNKSKEQDKRKDIKEFTIKKKSLKEKITILREQVKDLQEKYDASKKKINQILVKADRLNAMKEFKKESAPFLLAKKELKDLRAQASKLNTQQQVLKVNYGFKKIQNISQQYALDKYCL